MCYLNLNKLNANRHILIHNLRVAITFHLSEDIRIRTGEKYTIFLGNIKIVSDCISYDHLVILVSLIWPS